MQQLNEAPLQLGHCSLSVFVVTPAYAHRLINVHLNVTLTGGVITVYQIQEPTPAL